MFNKIEINNFRGIKSLEIDDFKRINLFVGKNNTGKTAVIEALFIASNPINFQLIYNTISFRNVNSLDLSPSFYKMERDNDILLKSYTDSCLPYSMTFSIPESFGEVFQEEGREIQIKDIYKLSVGLSNDNHSFETMLIPELKNKQITFKSEKILDQNEIEKFGIPKERVENIFIPAKLYIHIVDSFNRIQQNQESLKKIIKTLNEIEPNLQDIRLFKDEIRCIFSSGLVLPINYLGDGFYNIFNILCTIYSRENVCVFIDEIENSFHLTTLKLLWKTVLKAAEENNVQIFATTHSYECVEKLCEVFNEQEDEKKDELRIYRLMKIAEEIKQAKYDAKRLKDVIDSNWEIR